MPVRSSISKAVMRPSFMTPMRAAHAMVAGVDVGDEALDAVGDEFHRPASSFESATVAISSA